MDLISLNYFCNSMGTNHFDSLIQHLENSLKLPLPGVKAQFRMVPPTRPEYPPLDFSKVKYGAVLALLSPDNTHSRITFILRQNYNGVHSGQISFPGGGFEESDENFEKTAVRETFEEIGIPENEIKIVGALSQLYIPPSNFLVQPYLGFIPEKPVYNPDIKEVKEVFDLSVEELLNERSFQVKPIQTKTKLIDVPCFIAQNRMIWGATAMILNELLELINSSAVS